MTSDTPTVVVTGANGLVGSRICEVLSERGTAVRALVRRAGSAPRGPGIEEVVGDFFDADVAARATAGTTAAITTVHPMASDRDGQQRIGVEGTLTFARAAADAGAGRLVHISTAAVYDRSPGVGDVTETSALVADDAGDYPVTKRDLDLGLGELGGITRVLLRPPAILGPGESSVWNSLRPQMIRDDADMRRAVAEETWAWIHVTDLARMAAELAVGAIADAPDPERGPLAGVCTAVNVAAERATQRDYVGTVTAALGLEAEWVQRPAWTGQLVNARARAWGWSPTVELAAGLQELSAGLRGQDAG